MTTDHSMGLWMAMDETVRCVCVSVLVGMCTLCQRAAYITNKRRYKTDTKMNEWMNESIAKREINSNSSSISSEIRRLMCTDLNSFRIPGPHCAICIILTVFDLTTYERVCVQLKLGTSNIVAASRSRYAIHYGDYGSFVDRWRSSFVVCIYLHTLCPWERAQLYGTEIEWMLCHVDVRCTPRPNVFFSLSFGSLICDMR